MSKILELAKALEQTSSEQATRIEQAAQNALSEQEQRLKVALQAVAESCLEDTRDRLKQVHYTTRTMIDEASAKSAQLERQISAMRNAWMWTGACILILLLLCGLLSWYLWGKLNQVVDARQSLERLHASGAKIRIYNCDGKPCIPINTPLDIRPEQMRWTMTDENGAIVALAIPQGY